MSENGRPKVNAVANTSEDETIVCKDKWNYVLLVFLYVLQGIFAGVLHAVPLILQENGISFANQALLSVSSLPMWSKVLIAPLIECIYSARIGKRKSWLIPSQYLLGLMMLLSSFYIDTWVGEKNRQPNVVPLCVMMLFSSLLLTILDMVVDSWALTMLRRENIGYQATCNIIGFKIGYLFGHDLFILLRSKEISGYLGQTSAILSFSGYLYFWSVVLLVCNTVVLIFKKDTSLDMVGKDEGLSIVKSYRLIGEVLSLRSVRRFAVILLFCKAGLGPIFSLTRLKLIQGGMTVDKLVLLAVPLVPLQAILPFIFRRYFQGSQALIKYSRALIYMIPVGFMFSALLFYMPKMKIGGQLTTTFYVTYFIVDGIEYMVTFLLQSSFMSFTAKITDPKYGAVYLTVIHSIRIAGFMWPIYLSKALVDPLTFYKRGCTKVDKYECILVDGYFILVLIGSLFSICYLYFGGLKAMKKVQELDESEWRIQTKKNEGRIETIT